MDRELDSYNNSMQSLTLLYPANFLMFVICKVT